MRKGFFLIASLLMVIASCSVKEEVPKEEVPSSTSEVEEQELVFTADFAKEQTKTAFQEDETSIWWSPGDEICVYYGSSEGSRFTSSHEQEVAKAEFRGTIGAFTGVTESGDFNYFWAVYPYSAAVSCNGSSVVATLSGDQVAKAGSFAPNTNVTIAKSAGLALSFYNACSWFRFSVKKEGVRSVTFRGNNNEDIAGTFRVSMDGEGKPTQLEVIDGVKEITLTAPDGGVLEVGEKYYITLFPQTFENGFTVTFSTISEEGSRSINSSSTYRRSLYNTGTNFDNKVVYSPQVGNITFADANFKAYCVENFDTDDDCEISYAEALVVTEINCCTDEITSLDGVEYFANLESLIAAGSGAKYCSLDGQIRIDRSGSSLQDPEPGTSAASGQLTDVNISSFRKLTLINVSRNNSIASFELGNNANLKKLYCNYCNLTELNLTYINSLENLELIGNQLTSLDISNCYALIGIQCQNNQMTSLDFSNCLSLKSINCRDNQLLSLNVNNCIALTSIQCYNNQLTTLDATNCTALTSLYCYNNQLSILDISGCTALKNLRCYDNQLSSLDVSDCTALTTLYCYNNQLSSLNIGDCSVLTSLNCQYNQLTTLDVSNCITLSSLGCGGNQLSTLNVSNNTALTTLHCQGNQLSALDISNNTALTILSCYDNQLSALYVSNNTALTDLYCQSNQLSALDVSHNTALTYLWCHFNQLSTLNVGNNTALTSFQCQSNQLSTLDVNNNTALSFLSCNSNQLSTLDISNNTALTSLWCDHNQISALDVSNCTALTDFQCQSNQLSTLDVSQNSSLTKLDCHNNPNLTELWLKTGQVIADLKYSASVTTIYYK